MIYVAELVEVRFCFDAGIDNFVIIVKRGCADDYMDFHKSEKYSKTLQSNQIVSYAQMICMPHDFLTFYRLHLIHLFIR